MLEDEALLDFEVDLAAGEVRVVDAPEEGSRALEAAGLDAGALEDDVDALVRSRTLSAIRCDLGRILEGFGAEGRLELALRGHGASMTDHLWYREAGSGVRWADVSFRGREWDDGFLRCLETGDYARLRSCSPDVPDVTCAGHIRKAWWRQGDGIYLLKEPLREDGVDLEGALLASRLSDLLFGPSETGALAVWELGGRRVSASPLLLGPDEELVGGRRLRRMSGVDVGSEGESANAMSVLERTITGSGVRDASAHVARTLALRNLAMLADFHQGNYGIIRNVETGARRAARPFDFDRALGFPSDAMSVERLCEAPELALMLCLGGFSNLKTTWDWGWFDDGVLEGFDDEIRAAYEPHAGRLPANFGDLVAQMFLEQRAYVRDVVGAWRQTQA